MIPSDGRQPADCQAALRALATQGKFLFGNHKLEKEFYDCDLLEVGERCEAIRISLREVLPGDREGPDPPYHVSYPPFPNLRLYAYCWKSAHFGERMYLKYALTRGSPPELVIYSFHRSRY